MTTPPPQRSTTTSEDAASSEAPAEKRSTNVQSRPTETPAMVGVPPTVAITGISGALGRRVVAQLADRSDWRVLGLDPLPFPAGVPKPRYFTVHRVNVATTDLARLLGGACVLIHLATGEPDGPTSVDDEVRLIRRTLEAATVAGIDRVVVLSSAAVYGAWIDNPVPLTEEAPLRPHHPGFRYADEKRALEHEVAVWLGEHPGAKAVVLRPAVMLGHPDARAWLAKTMRPPLAARLSHEIAHQQYVHIDDLAAAVIVAFEAVVDGRLEASTNLVNVAADGWLTPEDAQELFGPSTRFPTDGPLGQRLVALVRRLVDGDRPEGVEPYLAWPWVVANDRLRSLGWAPRSSNAEALVASQRPLPGSRFVARHRQEVTLAVVGVAGATVSGLAIWFFRRWRRRR